jgi:hypothetical protein
MLEELIIDHTNYLGQQFLTTLTQAEGEIPNESIDCDPSTEMCAMTISENPTSIYDDVSQATLDAEASLYKWNLWMAVGHLS